MGAFRRAYNTAANYLRQEQMRPFNEALTAQIPGYGGLPYQPMPQQQLPGGSPYGQRQPYSPQYSPFAPYAVGPYNQQAFRMFGGYGAPQGFGYGQQQIPTIPRFQPAYNPSTNWSRQAVVGGGMLPQEFETQSASLAG